MRSTVFSLFLTALFLSGQWVNAAHSIETIDADHTHNASCIFCVLESNNDHTAVTTHSQLDAHVILRSTATQPSGFITPLKLSNTPIRAPPFSH